MSLQKLLGGVLIASIVAADAPGLTALSERQSIAISAPSTTPAGGACCVYVTAVGGEPAVEVEIEGHRIDARVIRIGDAGYLVCFEVPTGTNGLSVEVTATNAAGSAVASISIV